MASGLQRSRPPPPMSFVTSGDDSLMIWGFRRSPAKNATVWLGNYNGGVVSLGLAEQPQARRPTICSTALCVVNVDWLTPTANQWTAEAPGTAGSTLNGQNNGGDRIADDSPTTSFEPDQPAAIPQHLRRRSASRVLSKFGNRPPVNCNSGGTACDAATLHARVVSHSTSKTCTRLYLWWRTPSDFKLSPTRTRRNPTGIITRWIQFIRQDDRQPDQHLDQAALWTGAAGSELRWRLSGQIAPPHGSVVNVNYGLGLPERSRNIDPPRLVAHRFQPDLDARLRHQLRKPFSTTNQHHRPRDRKSPPAPASPPLPPRSSSVQIDGKRAPS